MARFDEPIRNEPPILISDADLPRLYQCITNAEGGRQEAAAEKLDAEIARARVLPAAEMPADVVTMGSRVTFRDEHTGVDRVVTLVFPVEADAAAGRISVLAPIGSALLGLRAGQNIEWGLPHGRTARIRVIAVEEQAARAGELQSA